MINVGGAAKSHPSLCTTSNCFTRQVSCWSHTVCLCVSVSQSVFLFVWLGTKLYGWLHACACMRVLYVCVCGCAIVRCMTRSPYYREVLSFLCLTAARYAVLSLWQFCSFRSTPHSKGVAIERFLDEEEDLDIAELISKGEVAWLHNGDARARPQPLGVTAHTPSRTPMATVRDHTAGAMGRANRNKRKVRRGTWALPAMRLSLAKVPVARINAQMITSVHFLPCTSATQMSPLVHAGRNGQAIILGTKGSFT
jgi:hypothetical protein